MLAEAAERLRVGRPHGGHRRAASAATSSRVVLPESGAEDAELLAGRIARAIDARPIAAGRDGRTSPPASPSCAPATRPTDLFERADEALYRAKEQGKARTHVAADGAEPLQTRNR